MDVFIIKAPCSAENKAGERDPEMHQTQKDNQWHFCLRSHIGVSARTGRTHTLRRVRPMNISKIRLRDRKLSDGGASAKYYKKVCEAKLAKNVKVDQKSALFLYHVDPVVLAGPSDGR